MPGATRTDPRQPLTAGAGGASRLATTLMTAAAPMVWGSTYLVTTRFLPPGHPVFAALARTLPAGLIAVALNRRVPRGAWWWRSLVLGVANMGVFFPLLFVAAQRLPGGVAAILGAGQPLVVALLAVPLLHDRLSRWRLGWGVVGVAGVALVVLRPGAGLDALGLAAGLAGAASMAVGVVLTKRWGRPPGVGPMALAGWQLTAAGVALLAPALLIDGVPRGIDAAAVGGYAWLGAVGALAAYTVWFAGIARLPAVAVAMLGLLSPLTAVVLGVVFAGETLTLTQGVGLGLAVVAMAAAQVTPAPRKDPS